MHLFKIEIYTYTTAGAPGPLMTTRYADNPEQARLICAEYENVKQTDADGNPTNMKAYNVKLYCIAYKQVADKAAFFAQFEA